MLDRSAPSTTTRPSGKPTRRRMGPSEREAAILDGAVHFFAEHGFEGTTRELARELGITQPLLYRYFPSKDALIERVYQEIYVRRWNPEWEDLISDRGLALETRLCRFYQAYSRVIYDYVWVRVFVYSGLKGMDINNRYLTMIREKILIPICHELRHETGAPGFDDHPVTEAEIEAVWGLHGAFFYRAVRHFVYNLPLADDPDQAIANDVRTFLFGATATG